MTRDPLLASELALVLSVLRQHPEGERHPVRLPRQGHP